MMKHIGMYTAVLAMMFYAGQYAVAQHGHGGGMGGGMGMGNGMGSTHSSMGHDHAEGGPNDASGSTSGTHRMTASQVLAHNSRLSARLSSLLPAGTNLQQAASGFKNLGQFVAAVHVSHNLGIPFSELRAKMTGPSPESLGKAIQQLKPEANSKTEAKRAKKQAKQDIQETQNS